MSVKRLHSVNQKAASGHPGGGGAHPLHPPPGSAPDNDDDYSGGGGGDGDGCDDDDDDDKNNNDDDDKDNDAGIQKTIIKKDEIEMHGNLTIPYSSISGSSYGLQSGFFFLSSTFLFP